MQVLGITTVHTCLVYRNHSSHWPGNWRGAHSSVQIVAICNLLSPLHSPTHQSTSPTMTGSKLLCWTMSQWLLKRGTTTGSLKERQWRGLKRKQSTVVSTDGGRPPLVRRWATRRRRRRRSMMTELLDKGHHQGKLGVVNSTHTPLSNQLWILD